MASIIDSSRTTSRQHSENRSRNGRHSSVSGSKKYTGGSSRHDSSSGIPQDVHPWLSTRKISILSSKPSSSDRSDPGDRSDQPGGQRARTPPGARPATPPRDVALRPPARSPTHRRQP